MIKEKREEIEGMEGARRASGIPSIGMPETSGACCQHFVNMS